MSNSIKKFFLFIVFFISISNLSFAKSIDIKLSPKEYKFPPTNIYNLKKLNPKWSVTFVAILSCNKSFDKRKIQEKNIKTILKTNNRVYTQSDKKKMLYLCNLMAKRKEYQFRESGFGFENTKVIIFIDQRGKMFAIENKKELRQMLGAIDNLAKLSLWLKATGQFDDGAYSYRYYKSRKLWRVRFSSTDLNGCRYFEDFRYYNLSGKMVKTKGIKNIKLKRGCEEIIM